MIKKSLKIVLMFFCAALIPILLSLNTFQAKRYAQLENEVRELDKKQYELVESNNRYIAKMSVLANPERIENLATTVLNMRKARPDEIIRVEIKGKKVGG